ncbi:unnamed protein product [Calypogeia fissa]
MKGVWNGGGCEYYRKRSGNREAAGVFDSPLWSAALRRRRRRRRKAKETGAGASFRNGRRKVHRILLLDGLTTNRAGHYRLRGNAENATAGLAGR